MALSLPPFGFWILAPIGVAVVAALLAGRGHRSRAAIGLGFGLGQYGIGIVWVIEFHAVGYIALLLLGCAFIVGATLATPPTGARLVALPAALIIADWLRETVPFGGFPLGGMSLSAAGSPLAPVARVGGVLLVTGAIALLGTALHRLTTRAVGRGAGSVVAAGLALLVVVALVVAGRIGPDGGPPGRPLRIAVVQGGGIRGLRAVRSDALAVFERHLNASQALQPPLDVVLWPEDVLDVPGPVAATDQAAQIAALARRLSATVIVGVVENDGPDHFRNAAVAWGPDGTIVARYDKVHRVPFGEYVPGRFLIRHLADLSIIPRDAVPGRGPGLLRVPAGPLGVTISYEVFFPASARAAVRARGQVLLVPTNASSYRTGQVPAQEVAAAQLRAWETGREVAQAAPTGYSAIIDGRGHLLDRTGLGRQQVLVGTVRLRSGRTLYVSWGDGWLLVAAFAALGIAWRDRLVLLVKSRRAQPLSPPA